MLQQRSSIQSCLIITKEKQINYEWYSFWQNLKQGYDFFEEFRIPPDVEVQNGQYVFEWM